MTPTRAARSVAIVYPYVPHYRQALFELLSAADTRHSYTIFADRAGNIPSIATIDPQKSRSLSATGTLNWRFVHNIWITPSILWQRGALRIATSPEFDVIIFMSDVQYLSTWGAALLGRLCGKRILMWGHGVRRSERGIRGAVRRIFYRLGHGMMLYGHRARRLLMADGFAASRLYVIYNSLDTARQLQVLEGLTGKSIANARRKIGIPEDVPLLICIGRMVQGKELHLLPAALSVLRAAGRQVHLLFVGDGPARTEIAGLVAAGGLQEQVHFAGEIYAEAELCPLIHMSDLCVSPGGVGLTAMHSLVYGTPVITHDDLDAQKPEFEAIEPGISGGFFRRGDPQDLANAIWAWLSVARDRDAVRQACRSRILMFYTAEKQRAIIDRAVDAVPATEIAEMDPMHEDQSSAASFPAATR